MSQENVELIERAVAAINARDLDGYLACCTADIELHTPMAAVGRGVRGRNRNPAVVHGPRGCGSRLPNRARTSGDDSPRSGCSPSCGSPAAGERAVCRSRTQHRRRTSTTSSRARSGEFESSWIAKRPSKPWGCRSRRCRGRTWRSCGAGGADSTMTVCPRCPSATNRSRFACRRTSQSEATS